MIPQAKLPNITLPTIRGIPSIPFVGSAAASGTSYIGEQFGNVPDLSVVLHIKTVKKALLEQIYALIQGELATPARAPIYAARAAQLADELTEVATFLTQVIAGVTAEANAATEFVNGKIGEINQARSAIESQGGPVQQLMRQRYDRCLGELAAQVGRIESTIGSIAN